jgi:uncharacterized protein (TIGR03435 family)
MLETTFNARVHQEMRTTDAYVLRPVAGIKPELVRSEVGKTSSWVAEFAETALHKPVIDESGLKGRFRFLWSSKRTLGELNNQLKTTLGLELVPQRRPVRMVVFEPAAQN